MDRVSRQSRQIRDTRAKSDEMSKLASRLEKAHERLAVKSLVETNKEVIQRLQRRIRDLEEEMRCWSMT